MNNILPTKKSWLVSPQHTMRCAVIHPSLIVIFYKIIYRLNVLTTKKKLAKSYGEQLSLSRSEHRLCRGRARALARTRDMFGPPYEPGDHLGLGYFGLCGKVRCKPRTCLNIFFAPSSIRLCHKGNACPPPAQNTWHHLQSAFLALQTTAADPAVRPTSEGKGG